MKKIRVFIPVLLILAVSFLLFHGGCAPTTQDGPSPQSPVLSRVATPTAHPAGGPDLDHPLPVSLGRRITLHTTTPDATIYLTLDGTSPSGERSGTTYRYEDPIPIIETRPTIIRAIAVKEGMLPSEILTVVYRGTWTPPVRPTPAPPVTPASHVDRSRTGFWEISPGQFVYIVALHHQYDISDFRAITLNTDEELSPETAPDGTQYFRYPPGAGSTSEPPPLIVLIHLPSGQSQIILPEQPSSVPLPVPPLEPRESVPSIEVVKTASPTTAPEGSEITYEFTVTNNGNVPLVDVELTDDKLGDISLDRTILAPGESISVQVEHKAECPQAVVVVTGSGGCEIENTATATGRDPEGTEVEAVDTALVTVVKPAPTPPPGPPLTFPEGHAYPAPQTIIGDETLVQAVISVTGEGTVITFADTSSQVARLQEGSIILLPPNPHAPEGLMRRVTAVALSPGRVQVQTEQANMEDAFDELVIDGSTDRLAPRSLADLPPGVRMVQDRNTFGTQFVVALDKVLHETAQHGQIGLEGEIIITPELIFRYEKRFLRPVQEIDLGFRTRINGQIQVVATLEAIKREWEGELFSIPLAPIWFGPLWITTRLVIFYQVEADLSVTLSAGVSIDTIQGAAGVRYRRGSGWTGYGNYSQDFSPVIELEGRAAVKAMVGPKFNARLFGAVGPEVFVGPYARAEGWIQAGIPPEVCHEIAAGMDVIAGGRASVFGYNLGTIELIFHVFEIPLSEGCWLTPVRNVTRDTYHDTIQEAVDESTAGDEIVVSPGTYQENIVIENKNITLRSTNPQNPEDTVIDGGRNDSVIRFLQGDESTLKGFTIQNGRATYGGGIYIVESSPTITDNILIHNTTRTQSGGGIYVFHSSSPTITGNTITENTASWDGGGIAVSQSSSPTITGNTITGNTGRGGGGIAVSHSSSPTITGNTITGNTGSGGGGILVYKSLPTIAENIITSNEANHSGGGISLIEASPALTGNLITHNTANWDGGGLFMRFSSSPIVTGNTITHNRASRGKGGGIYVGSQSTIFTANAVWPPVNCPPAIAPGNTVVNNTHQGGLSTPACNVYGWDWSWWEE